MKTHRVIVESLEQVNEEICLRLDLKTLAGIHPGQYVQVCDPDPDALLPVTLFPCRMEMKDILFCGGVHESWLPGKELHMRGPKGNGFSLPPLARRVALTTLDLGSLNPLLPLAGQALELGAEVTLLTDKRLHDLPPQIEVLPLEEIDAGKDWADYLAAISSYEGLPKFKKKLSHPTRGTETLQVEVLVDTPMPCADGVGCGACAVQTRKGWRLACKDGPVFQLDDLEIGEAARG